MSNCLQQSSLDNLRELLLESGFRGSEINRRLGYSHYSLAGSFEHIFLFPIVRQFLSDSDRLDKLISLFFMNYGHPVETVRQLLGSRLMDDLLAAGILVESSKQIFSEVRITEYDDLIIVTDPPMRSDGGEVLRPNISPKCVMNFYPDTYALASAIPRHDCGDVLDVATGCGFQALVASQYHRRVTGIDINPRAIEFANLNKRLNRRENITFEIADYNCTQNGQYNLILANPPFMPNCSEDVLYADGGELGDVGLRAIIHNIVTTNLSNQGRCLIVTVVSLIDGSNVESRIKSIIGKAPLKFQFESLLNNMVFQDSVRNYLLFFIASRYGYSGSLMSEKAKENARHFLAQGIKGIEFGIIELGRI